MSTKKLPRIESNYLTPSKAVGKKTYHINGNFYTSQDSMASIMDPDWWFPTDEGVMINKSQAKRFPEYKKYKDGPKKPTFPPGTEEYNKFYEKTKLDIE